MTRPRPADEDQVGEPGRLRSIGPELVAAASDNDPTNIGTAAAVGAQTGYQLSWITLLVAPLLGVVLTIAAQVGAVARDDLQSLTRRRYGRGPAAVLLVSLVAVNLVTIAADLQAGAAGVGLLAGLDPRWLVVPLAAVLAGLLLAGRYAHVVAVLRYLMLGFLAFGVAAVLARPDWPRLLEGSLVPRLSLRSDEVTGSLALLGTTLTSYVYVWETIGRGVEGRQAPTDRGRELARARSGAVVGAVFTAVILWFMLVAAAATLGEHHQQVTTAQDAARALRPLAGSLAADLFAVGIIVSAVVAVPVLLATTAYVVGAQFGWRRGLSEPISRAPGFYAVLVASVGLGLAVSLAGIPVIGMLVAASVVGGLGAPIGLVLLVRLARDPTIMGPDVITFRLALAGWAVAIVVGGFGLLYVVGAAAGAF
jgi:NRAMP (natural resistance-associated macrophage protein)-like metal ion transporter